MDDVQYKAADVDELPLWDQSRNLNALPESAGAVGAWAADVHASLLEVRELAAAERMTRMVPPDSGRAPERFQPLPLIGVLRPEVESVLRDRVQTVVRCLTRLIRKYPRDEELRGFLDVPAVLDKWILRHEHPDALAVDLCRLDLLGDRLGSVRVLEFNPSSPGGVVSAGAALRFWRKSGRVGALLGEWGIPEAPVEREDWFVDWLLEYGRARGVSGEDARRVGLFHAAYTARHELDLMQEQLRRRGHTPVEMLPDDVGEDHDIRLGYFKHLPVVPGVVERWGAFCARATRGDLVFPNALAERWVAENKLCLAALSDPRFRRFFDPTECAALDALVPWSRKLGDGITPARAVTDRERLVLKAPYGCWGQGVWLGKDCDVDTWHALVRDGAERGWLAQEVVANSPIDTDDGQYFTDLVVLTAGQVIGYAARLSRKSKFNIAQGGASYAVISPNAL